jgi:hypothetical protein
MELEAVGRVSMRNMGLEIRWKVDDIDGAKWAFFRTDTATNTETFGNEGDLRLGGDFNTKPTAPNNRARLLAFLSAFLEGICQDIGH